MHAPKPVPPVSERDIARFWEKVDRRGQTECWLWTGATTNGGYGRFFIRSNGVQYAVLAHRLARRIATGSDSSDPIRHACGNRLCCNPLHIKP